MDIVGQGKRQWLVFICLLACTYQLLKKGHRAGAGKGALDGKVVSCCGISLSTCRWPTCCDKHCCFAYKKGLGERPKKSLCTSTVPPIFALLSRFSFFLKAFRVDGLTWEGGSHKSPPIALPWLNTSLPLQFLALLGGCLPGARPARTFV